jgi:glycosyltransferase involved in cell wall biosynthesis
MESNILNNYINNPKSLNEESLMEIKKLTEDYPFFQTTWMLYLKNLKIIEHPEFKNELKKNAIRIADRKKLYHFLNSDKKIILNHSNAQSNEEIEVADVKNYNFEKEETLKNRIGKNSLIDNFIATRPKIRINNDDNYNTKNDISESSVSINDEIITETFANILVQQKKYGKAIEAFKKLSLKIPEKNTYFAGRIEEINNLKNK